MLGMAKDNIVTAFQAVLERDPKRVGDAENTEEYIDFLNKEISHYISKLIVNETNEQSSAAVSAYFKITGNIERIGDHAMNIAEYTKNMKKWDISFSDDARTEIKKMKQVSMNILNVIDFTDATTPAAQLETISKYEFLMDDMEKKYRKRQIKRAKKGDCKAESGILFSELLTDFERIGDYALNIGELHADM